MSITTATASEMWYSAQCILDELDSAIGKRDVYVYTAEDGSAIVLQLTSLEAHTLETAWYGEQTANENYNRKQD